MYSQVDECMFPLLFFRAKNSVVFRRTWAQRSRTHRRTRWPVDHQLLTYPGLGLAWSSWSLQGTHEYTQVKCANCHESWNSLDAQREGMGLKPATVSRCQRLGIYFPFSVPERMLTSWCFNIWDKVSLCCFTGLSTLCAQSNLDLTKILQPLTPKFWDQRCAPKYAAAKLNP